MSTRARLLVSIALAFAMLYLISLHPPVGALLALALLTMVIVGQRIDVRRSERQERARLADDAQRQHAAWVAGNDQYAVHGRYAPVIESKWGYPE
jgi:ABC-type transport system involved in cytochrome bd biosynthesis fused ATPase/permease subunit